MHRLKKTHFTKKKVRSGATRVGSLASYRCSFVGDPKVWRNTWLCTCLPCPWVTSNDSPSVFFKSLARTTRPIPVQIYLFAAACVKMIPTLEFVILWHKTRVRRVLSCVRMFFLQQKNFWNWYWKNWSECTLTGLRFHLCLGSLSKFESFASQSKLKCRNSAKLVLGAKQKNKIAFIWSVHKTSFHFK